MAMIGRASGRVGHRSAQGVTCFERECTAEEELEPWLIDRRLRLQSALQHLGDHLHLSLRLHETAGDAQHVLQPAVACDRRRNGGVRRLGARRQRAVECSHHRGPIADRSAELGDAEM
jgi:hypothetical protein